MSALPLCRQLRQLELNPKTHTGFCSDGCQLPLLSQSHTISIQLHTPTSTSKPACHQNSDHQSHPPKCISARPLELVLLHTNNHLTQTCCPSAQHCCSASIWCPDSNSSNTYAARAFNNSKQPNSSPIQPLQCCQTTRRTTSRHSTHSSRLPWLHCRRSSRL